jgi:zinc/manganese transport system substrate-binding protein
MAVRLRTLPLLTLALLTLALAVLISPIIIAANSSASPATQAAQSPSGGSRRTVTVVAAENFWGSIASQIGGRHAHVISIITNPNTDPHSYEPTALDARSVAGAQLVIENGIGYDPWAARLLAADQGTQTVLNVGGTLGLADGANPHRWYNPADVQQIIRQLVADFSKLDPADSAYFTSQRAHFDTSGLREYRSLIKAIGRKFGGAPVGASESIFAMLAPALRLRLITPPAFLKAISEGGEVSAADKLTIDHQIKHHLIKIYVYNSQNVTPDVQAQIREAKAAHLPIATITETLTPPQDSYQAWQDRQLRGIEAALAASSSAASSSAASSSAASSRTASSRGASSRSASSRAASSRSASSRAVSSSAASSRTASSRTASSRTASSRTASSRTASSRAASSRTANTAPPRTAEARTKADR